MTVTVTEMFDSRKATYDESFKRDATRTYLIETSNKNDDGYYIIYQCWVAGILPKIWDYHPSDFLSRVRSVELTQWHGSKFWKGVVNYSTHGKDPAKQDENPLNKPVIRSFSTKEQKRFTWVDIYDVPIFNSAKTLYAPLEVPFAVVTLQFERNEAYFDGSICLTYVDHLNSSTFSGADPGTVKCDSISAAEKYEGDYHYWAVTYVFSYNVYGWQPRVLNEGLMQKSGSGGSTKWKPCIDGKGNPVRQPVPLDSSGAQIPPQNLPGSAIFNTFEVIEVADFNALGLPA